MWYSVALCRQLDTIINNVELSRTAQRLSVFFSSCTHQVFQVRGDHRADPRNRFAQTESGSPFSSDIAFINMDAQGGIERIDDGLSDRPKDHSEYGLLYRDHRLLARGPSIGL